MTNVIACPLWQDFKLTFTERSYKFWLRECQCCGRSIVLNGDVIRKLDGAPATRLICAQCASDTQASKIAG